MDLSTSSTVSFAGQRGLVADARSLNQLNTLAGKDSKAAIKETARQFESLFMQELLKSMRDASMKSGLIDNPQSDLGTQLLDQQWGQMMSGVKGGLGELIEKQLSQQMAPAAPVAIMPAPLSTVDLGRAASSKASVNQANFVSKHNQAAEQVSRETGIPASYMIGQAGHETGWGRSEIRKADGGSAFNLFGIKAGPGWKGKVAEVTTTEYINGQPQKVVAKFRAYDSYADSFRDYARLISKSPRYAEAMNNLHSAQAFASSLQKGGYATDPQYATKLSRAIHTTLNLQRAQA